MGWAYAVNVKPAGDYLTELLLDAITLKYNEHFYRDGDDSLEQELREKFGMGTHEDGSPAISGDLAVAQLERSGFVKTRQLPERMGDGEHDYEITITEAYLEFIQDGGEFQYRDMDL